MKKIRGVFNVLLNVLNLVRLLKILLLATQGVALSQKQNAQLKLWEEINDPGIEK